MTHILYNPLAGGCRGYAGVQAVLRQLKPAEHADPDITQLDIAAWLAALDAGDSVIVLGGDGTLHHFVNALDGAMPPVPVYVWRFGTGNDFLRDVQTDKSRPVLLNDYIANLPTAEIDGKKIRFLNNCSFGLDGKVCELGEALKRQGQKKTNYVLLAIRMVVRDYHSVDATVTVDGTVRHYQRVWIGSTLNGRFIGGGMKVAPGQDRRSDQLCCVVWHGTGRMGTLLRLPTLLWGGHVRLRRKCDVFFGKDITVTFSRPTALQLDGEVISGVTTYHARKD